MKKKTQKKKPKEVIKSHNSNHLEDFNYLLGECIRQPSSK